MIVHKHEATHYVYVYLGILYINAATVTEAPLPQNVSIGQPVNFTCATTNSQDIITWSTIPNIDTATTALQSLPGGGIRSVLSFTALLEHSDTTVRCIVTDPNTAAGTIKSALVLVQGESFCIQILCLSIYTLYRSPVKCW